VGEGDGVEVGGSVSVGDDDWLEQPLNRSPVVAVTPPSNARRLSRQVRSSERGGGDTIPGYPRAGKYFVRNSVEMYSADRLDRVVGAEYIL
jgi:hypothetical protein